MGTMCDSSEEGCRYGFFDIAIVGGGCSGVLVAVQLLRNHFSGRIAIIESRKELGRGLAYSTPFEQHLLNVPARAMSGLPTEPSHFLDWLRARHWPGASPELFAPRKVYGEYLADLLDTESHQRGAASMERIEAEASDLRLASDGVNILLSNGSTVRAGRAVLALGNPASSTPVAGSPIETDGRWHASPWIGDALRAPFPGERILLIGSGLTAVDAALALIAQSRDCDVYAISRRGLLPQVHDLRRDPADAPVFEQPGNLCAMFRELRSRIQFLRESDGCWRSAVDALRPVSNDLWQQMPLADQQRFLRHLRSYWETHRHRMAPQIRIQIDDYRREGTLRVVTGRICNVARDGDLVRLEVVGRNGSAQMLAVDRVINCAGIHDDYSRAPRPLNAALIRRGLASANQLGIGFRTDDSGALIDGRGRTSTTLFTLGPPRRGELFETTAVPEIRLHAEALAKRLNLLGQWTKGQLN